MTKRPERTQTRNKCAAFVATTPLLQQATERGHGKAFGGGNLAITINI